MDMQEITNTIEELENGDTTFDNCIKLSALYSVRDNLKSDTRQELEDILPTFRMYSAVKTKYQLKELDKNALIFAMTDMCREITEIKAFLSSSFN